MSSKGDVKQVNKHPTSAYYKDNNKLRNGQIKNLIHF